MSQTITIETQYGKAEVLIDEEESANGNSTFVGIYPELPKSIIIADSLDECIERLRQLVRVYLHLKLENDLNDI